MGSITRVLHIFGVQESETYLPMMWETYFKDNKGNNLFDFKYLTKGNNIGLSKPAVLAREIIHEIFHRYEMATGKKVI